MYLEQRADGKRQRTKAGKNWLGGQQTKGRERLPGRQQARCKLRTAGRTADKTWLGGQQIQGRDKRVSPSSQSRRGGAGLTAVSGQEAGDSLSSGQQTQLWGRETAGRTAGKN